MMWKRALSLRAGLAAGFLAQAGLGLRAATPSTTETALQAEYQGTILPVLTEYCIDCHNPDKAKGDLDLEPFKSVADLRRHTRVWEKVVDQIAEGEMPPKEKPQPSGEQKTRLMTWVRSTLEHFGREREGDPGPVVLRRLSNAEYTHTIRDLTGVPSLDPAREFPVDGAAGEGFTNTGMALVMSPTLLTKYLDAGKDIASHAVLLPDGIAFSAKTSRRDWTDETLTAIREFYGRFCDSGGGQQVNLQGIKFGTNEGGRLPVEKYLAATLSERERLGRDAGAVDAVARERQLSAKYLGLLWAALNDRTPSQLLDGLRERWRTANPAEAAALAAEIGAWQAALWKFNSVGHIGKLNGPTSWLEPVTPLVPRQDFRVKLAPGADGADVTVWLAAGDAGDGSGDDVVVWENPRLVAPGRPDVMLRDVRAIAVGLDARRARLFAVASQALAAAAEAGQSPDRVDLPALAARHGLEPGLLKPWFDFLGIGSGDATLTYLKGRTEGAAGYGFVSGWAEKDALSVVANASDGTVRIPGVLKGHGFAMHPAPTVRVAAGWKSPIAGAVRVEAKIQHAHPECGNGIAWTLERRRGTVRQRLATGASQGPNLMTAGPVENLAVQPGDLLSVILSPRDGNHSCDLTAVDLTVSAAGQTWDLAADVSPNILEGNPHADRLGHPAVWHFYSEPDGTGDSGTAIPPGSILARWLSAPDPAEKHRLAEEFQQLLKAGPAVAADHPDAVLYRQLGSLGGIAGSDGEAPVDPAVLAGSTVGIDPALFGKDPTGQPVAAGHLVLKAPHAIEIRLPASLANGCEFVTSGTLLPGSGRGSVQLAVQSAKPSLGTGLTPSAVQESQAAGAWTGNNRRIALGSPVVVNDGSEAGKRFESGFDAFRQLFPAALSYTRIVPVDEVVTLTLFFREDDHLRRLMLTDAETAALHRLWDRLHFVSQDALQLVDGFAQLWQFATQDADPKVFEPLRQPIHDRAEAFKKLLIETEPKHIAAVLDWAAKAYRRPLTDAERTELTALYGRLRAQEMPHDDAIRMMLARVFVAPAFLYRTEKPVPGARQGPLNDYELASRLSYFLWSSAPDAPLLAAAAQGKLRDPAELTAQTHRMLRDARVRRMSEEFGCQWLNVKNFDTLDEKSERHFPEFRQLRGAMYEEAIRFFTDFFQENRPVTALLGADYTFVNEPLARHYGIDGVTGDQWRRIEGVMSRGRGGVLGLAATLAKQSGASRTSPILRGNWLCETLLGEKLPKPPKGVPILPEDESATEGLTVRQLVEKHSSDAKCAGCHVRIDPFGYALEAYDAIGRVRDRDLGGRPIDTKVTLGSGAAFDGLAGLRRYLMETRRDSFNRQFCRKLLGYALGRSVQLSDHPLLDRLTTRLATPDARIGDAIDAIVLSPQFREIRGASSELDD